MLIQRRFLIAALAAMILFLGAAAFADGVLICPNPDCPNPENCPGATTGICPFAGQPPRDGSGQGPGPMGPRQDCPEDCPEECPNDGAGQQNRHGRP